MLITGWEGKKGLIKKRDHNHAGREVRFPENVRRRMLGDISNNRSEGDFLPTGSLVRTKTLLLAALRVWELKQRGGEH